MKAILMTNVINVTQRKVSKALHIYIYTALFINERFAVLKVKLFEIC